MARINILHVGTRVKESGAHDQLIGILNASASPANYSYPTSAGHSVALFLKTRQVIDRHLSSRHTFVIRSNTVTPLARDSQSFDRKKDNKFSLTTSLNLFSENCFPSSTHWRIALVNDCATGELNIILRHGYQGDNVMENLFLELHSENNIL